FDNYGKQGLLCGSDGLPHLIVSGDQRHWGEFITPGILFLYIAGWIGWVGRSYLIAIRDDKKPTQKEIIIDVPLASRLVFRGFSWPVAAYHKATNSKEVNFTYEFEARGYDEWFSIYKFDAMMMDKRSSKFFRLGHDDLSHTFHYVCRSVIWKLNP
ncbi:hypothetical protein R6Q59_002421, partial [Mikania micrantha]